jgi:hypothetical protein
LLEAMPAAVTVRVLPLMSRTDCRLPSPPMVYTRP